MTLRDDTPETYPITFRMIDGDEIDFDIDASELNESASDEDGYPVELLPADATEVIGALILDRHSPAYISGYIPLQGGGQLRALVRCRDIAAVIESEATQVKSEKVKAPFPTLSPADTRAMDTFATASGQVIDAAARAGVIVVKAFEEGAKQRREVHG